MDEKSLSPPLASSTTRTITHSSGTEDSTPSKTRRERPCSECRRRKSRCVMLEGSEICEFCRFHNYDCTFLHSPQPRKGRISLSELTTGRPTFLMEGKRRAVPVVGPPSPPLTTSSGKPPVGDATELSESEEEAGDEDTESSESDEEEDGDDDIELSGSEEEEDSDDDIELCGSEEEEEKGDDDIELCGSEEEEDGDDEDISNNGLKKPLTSESYSHGVYCGFTTEFEPALIGLCHFDDDDEYKLPNDSEGTIFRQISKEATFLMFSKKNREKVDVEQEAADLEAVERLLHPHKKALINLYFWVVHSSFPILQRSQFYDPSRPPSPLLLASVCLLALGWWDHDEELSRTKKPDVFALDKLSARLFADAAQFPQLSTIQAGLLLLQRPNSRRSWVWVFTSQVVALGQELGLHIDCSGWRIPRWEKGLRKRLAWGIYMQDKWMALTHGRPSHISSPNWGVKQIVSRDFDDEHDIGDVNEDESYRGQTLFMQMVKLSQITAEVLDGFFTVEMSKYRVWGIENILERAKPVQIKLKEWYARLPECLRMDTLQTTTFNSNGCLHVSYFATEITLHRAIVKSLDTCNSSYLIYICRTAAKTRFISAIDFVNRLKPEHWRAFWYFTSTVSFALFGTFGTLLWATSQAPFESEFYKARLDEYRWTLHVSSKNAEFLTFAIRAMDSSATYYMESVSESRHSSTLQATAMEGRLAAVEKPPTDKVDVGAAAPTEYNNHLDAFVALQESQLIPSSAQRQLRNANEFGEQDFEPLEPPVHLEHRFPGITMNLFEKITFVFNAVLRNPIASVWEPSCRIWEKRLRWICVCGRYLYEDLPEDEMSAAEELVSGISLNQKEFNLILKTSIFDIIKFWGWWRTTSLVLPTTENSPRNLQNTSTRDTIQEQRQMQLSPSNAHQNPTQTTSNTASNNGGVVTTSEYVLLCFNETVGVTKLQHSGVDNKTYDITIFQKMQEEYNKFVPSWKRRFGLRKLDSIDFAKFELYYDKFVTITEKLPPNYLPYNHRTVYAYSDSNRCPPIRKEIMMRHFLHPQLIRNPTKRDLLELIPKKKGKLDLDQDKNLGVEGWGLHFSEELDWRFCCMLLSFFQLLIFIFAVAWSAVKSDVQGGFGVSSYFASVTSIVIALGSWQAALDKGVF